VANASSALGTTIEASKAPNGWGVRRGCPLPTRRRVWGGVLPLLRKMSLNLKMFSSSATWTLFFVVQLPVVHAKNTAFGLKHLACCMQIDSERRQSKSVGNYTGNYGVVLCVIKRCH